MYTAFRDVESIKLKTVPVEDARDKLAMVHGDITKLAEAALDRRNLPQAVVIVGYDHGGGTLGPRLRRFAREHGLDRWSNPGNGIQVLDLPASPGRQHYVRAVVGVWTGQADESS